jgi:hypothetical protein
MTEVTRILDALPFLRRARRKWGRQTMCRPRRPVRPALDRLEDRNLLSAAWVAQGPGPLRIGQPSGMEAQGNPDVGAVNALAPDPRNVNILYAATTDGGIWKTVDATDSSPLWTPLTENQPTLAVGAIAFSPLDPTDSTLYAGTGSFTNGSFGAEGLTNGGEGLGVLKTTDGGDTWVLLGTSDLAGENIRSILPTALSTPTGQVVLAGAAGGKKQPGGVFVSTDGGTSWALVPSTDLPTGGVRSLVQDPNNADVVYAGVIGQGVFRGQFSGGGFTWTDIGTTIPSDVDLSATNNLQLAASAAGGVTTLFLLTAAPSSSAHRATGLSHLVYSTNPAAASVVWNEFATVDPTTGASVPQINEDDQEVNNLALSADPTSPSVVWVTGSAAKVGNTSKSIVYRGDASVFTGSQWELAVLGGAAGGDGGSTPTIAHSDGRYLGFDVQGNLLLTNDGGIYKLVNPEGDDNPSDQQEDVNNNEGIDETDTSRYWVSESGTLQDTEYYSVGIDSVDFTGQDVLVGGAQDNGMGVQPGPGQAAWDTGFNDDVTHVDVDNTAAPAVLYGIGSKFLKTDAAGTVSSFFRGKFTTKDHKIDVGVRLANDPSGAIGSGLDSADQQVTGGAYIPFALDAVDPARLLIGLNGLYEDPQAPNDPTHLTGDVIKDVTPVDSNGNSEISGTVSALAYGGTAGGVAKLDVAFVGTTGGQVFVRTVLAASGDRYANFSLQETFATGSDVRSISLDPSDWHTAYIVTSDSSFLPHVWQMVVNDDGTLRSLTEITGNLATLADKLESVVALNPTPGATVLVVGGVAAGSGTGLTGVFRSQGAIGGATVWAPLPGGLPNVDVHDLVYDPTNDVLAAATFGRGAWTLAGASQVLAPTQSGVVLTYGGPGTAAGLAESAAGTANVTVSEVSPGRLEINLNGATFAAGSTASAPGLTYEHPGSPATSTFAVLDISTAGDVTTLTADLPDDPLTVGAIADAAGGLENLDLAAVTVTVTGAVDTTAVTGAGFGSVSLSAATALALVPGASVTAGDGTIILQANQAVTPAAGDFAGIDVNGATVRTTGAGNILLAGRGGGDPATGLHDGVLLRDGAQVVAAGTGAVNLQGTGGAGTLDNFGVAIQGVGTLVSSAAGTFPVTGQGGTSLSGVSPAVVLRPDARVTLAGPAVSVTGGPGPNTYAVAAPAGSPVNVSGSNPSAPADAFLFDATELAVRTRPGTYTAADRQPVLYGNVQTLDIVNAAAVDTFYGPDTLDRGLLTGLTPPEHFVGVLFLNVLGRPGSSAEIKAWVAVLQGPGGSQQVVADGIEGSAEGRTRLVDTWYLTYLGRPAAAAEAQAWVNQLLGGPGVAPRTEEQVLAAILGTPEFLSHAQTLFSSGTAAERYVEALYLLLLDRTPGSAELAAQVNALGALGQAGVALEFLTGPEFRTDLAEAYYNVLLHRPSGGTAAGWAASGVDAFTMRVDFESGPEFFRNGALLNS